MRELHGEEGRKKLWEMIKDIKVALMATYDTQGTAFHARPMVAMQQEFGGTLWFFTSKDSRKADEIRNNPTALLTYAEPKLNNYVSVFGKAYIVDDQAKINELWSEHARTWFPEGKTDPNLTLIRFDAVEAEFWDSPSSVAVYAWGYVKARLTGEQPKPGEVGHLKFAQS